MTELPILTEKQNMFVKEYLLNGNNATEAYRTVYAKETTSTATCCVEASRLLKNPKITLWIDEYKKTIQEHIGLPYEFDFETLNFEGENTQGLKKLINNAIVKIHKSREDFLFVGTDGSEFRNGRCNESITNSGQLFSKDNQNGQDTVQNYI